MGVCLSSSCWEYPQQGLQAVDIPVQELMLPSEGGILLESSDNPNPQVIVSPLLKDTNFAVIIDSDDDSIDDEAVEELLKEDEMHEEEAHSSDPIIDDDEFKEVSSDNPDTASDAVVHPAE